MQNKEIEEYYNRIKSKKIAENRDEIKFKICKVYSVMNNFEDRLCDEMQENVAEIKEYIDQLENKVKELEKENTDIKDVYIRTAKHLEKKGLLELSEYMLAQIEATPTFTTWEEYTTWVSKQVIRDKIDELNKEYNEILSDYGNIDTDVTFNIPNENIRKHLDELVIKIITLQELLEEK